MADIRHRIGVKDASPAKVYEAITSVDALAAWWTADTKEAGSAKATECRIGPPVTVKTFTECACPSGE